MSDTVCRCMVVDREEIEEAIHNDGATTLEDVEELTGAGGGCGRCTPMIEFILKEELNLCE